jgi:multiple sugar transport system substrate-binding protein
MPFALDRDAMAEALDALDAVIASSPPETLDWNAISLSEAMVSRDDIVFTPAIYGYATYAEADMRAPLGFSNFCGLASPFPAGSMLGGTGLAVSAATKHKEAAIAFTRFCLSAPAQERIIPEHHGQPALASAGEDADNDARFGKYFTRVRASIETAWIRPRRPRYIRFQAEAGRLVESYCRRLSDQSSTIAAIGQAAEIILGD